MRNLDEATRTVKDDRRPRCATGAWLVECDNGLVGAGVALGDVGRRGAGRFIELALLAERFSCA